MKNMNKTKRLALLSLFIAIELVLMLTPLGYIPIGPLKATTLHIPVILITLLLSWKEGAIIGAVFGFTSVVMNTITPTPVSFVFSPFYSLGEFQGNFSSLIIAIIPRIAIAFVAYGVFVYLKKWKVKESLSVILASIAGSLCNTILVMSGIFIFFGQSYAAAKEIAFDSLFALIATTITTVVS